MAVVWTTPYCLQKLSPEAAKSAYERDIKREAERQHAAVRAALLLRGGRVAKAKAAYERDVKREAERVAKAKAVAAALEEAKAARIAKIKAARNDTIVFQMYIEEAAATAWLNTPVHYSVVSEYDINVLKGPHEREARSKAISEVIGCNALGPICKYQSDHRGAGAGDILWTIDDICKTFNVYKAY
jgi:hypothetical protein